jgi:hypothetical protein
MMTATTAMVETATLTATAMVMVMAMVLPPQPMVTMYDNDGGIQGWQLDDGDRTTTMGQ